MTGCTSQYLFIHLEGQPLLLFPNVFFQLASEAFILRSSQPGLCVRIFNPIPKNLLICREFFIPFFLENRRIALSKVVLVCPVETKCIMFQITMGHLRSYFVTHTFGIELSGVNLCCEPKWH